MKDFIEATDIDIWDVVENGYDPPRYVLEGILELKLKNLWNKDNRKKHFLASKVK